MLFRSKNKPQIVIGTPGRLITHIERKRLKLHGIKMVVLDEADEMLSMGFIKDIDTIIKKMPKYKQTLMFSATLSKQIIELTDKYQDNPLNVTVGEQQLTVSTTQQFSIQINERGKFKVLTSIINENKYKRILIFCNTRYKVNDLTHNLSEKGYSVEAMHGEIKQAVRTAVLKGLKKARQ